MFKQRVLELLLELVNDINGFPAYSLLNKNIARSEIIDCIDRLEIPEAIWEDELKQSLDFFRDFATKSNSEIIFYTTERLEILIDE